MTRHRPLLTAVLGLLFLVQGFAVAAAAQPSFKKGDDVAVQVDHSAMPCAGHMQGDPGDASDGASCCDEDCPNMTTCALGHLAVSAAMHVEQAPLSREFSAARVVPPVAAVPQTLLRPPIAFQA